MATIHTPSNAPDISILHNRFPCCGRGARLMRAGEGQVRECRNPKCADATFTVDVVPASDHITRSVGKPMFVARWTRTGGGRSGRGGSRDADGGR